jgi:alkylated DNA repair protein alkB family protein 8
MEFYEKYGTDFSKSRFRVWPQVSEFIQALSQGAIVYDIGCGNGKNMSIRPDVTTVGVEPSAALCAECTVRGLDVVQGDARSLPFADASADAVLMIAALHHLSPAEQTKALFEIQRVLKPGGRALITCWAVEQPPASRRSFVPGLNYVKWEGKEDAPLPYWVLDRVAAVALKDALPSQLTCEALVWNAGNWNFILQKS